MNNIRRTVVVGVDGSETALRAVRWAAAEAERRGVPLRLITAVDWTRDRMVGLPGLGDEDREIRHDVARRTLARAAAEAEAAGAAVEHQLVVGFPAEVLALEAREAQLLVIGDNGHGRLDGMLAGSVAVAMATRAPCPVVVVRGPGIDAGGPSSPVVVGVDGSAASEAAVAFAMDAASARHVSVIAVHSWHEPMMIGTVPAQTVDQGVHQRDQQQQQLTEKMAEWADKYPGVFVESLVTREPPATSLLEQAQRAQLVVVGTRGHGELAGMILGSVSNALLHRCPCPVAVVRPDTSAAG